MKIKKGSFERLAVGTQMSVIVAVVLALVGTICQHFPWELLVNLSLVAAVLGTVFLVLVRLILRRHAEAVHDGWLGLGLVGVILLVVRFDQIKSVWYFLLPLLIWLVLPLPGYWLVGRWTANRRK